MAKVEYLINTLDPQTGELLPTEAEILKKLPIPITSGVYSAHGLTVIVELKSDSTSSLQTQP